MKTGLKVLLIVVGIIVVVGVAGCQFYSGNYNKMVELVAISAASRRGKWNTPVEMQQKATLRR